MPAGGLSFGGAVPSQPLPKPWVFPAAFGSLLVFLAAASFLAGSWHAPDKIWRTETVEHEAKLDSADDVRALGGGQPVPCADLNLPPELRCEAFQSDTFSVILVTP